jgi:hypothetical protein
MRTSGAKQFAKSYDFWLNLPKYSSGAKQAAEKLLSGRKKRQGTALAVPQAQQNKRWALQAAEKRLIPR